MGLLEKLKAAIGFDGSGSRSSAGGTGRSRSESPEADVTVEREPEPEPSTGAEAAVKGTESAETTATAVEKPAGGVPDEPDDRPESGAPTTNEAESVADEDAESTPRSDADESSTPVDEVKGIGPAYAERLTSTGVETVDDLVTADPDDVGDDTDISPKRIARWQDRARESEE
jgi:predicted flap endonuclease-1-like 5' DNA nuclease